jgi:hypothetical protein
VKGWIPKLTTKKAAGGWGALSFLYAINQGIPWVYQSGTTFQKIAQFFVGVPVYRLTGSAQAMNAIAGPGSNVGNIKPQFNVGKAFNTVTLAGIAATVYGMLPFSFLPFRGPAKRIGPYVAAGAAIGGGFDPYQPTPPTADAPASSPMVLTPPTNWGGSQSTPGQGGFVTGGLQA